MSTDMATRIESILTGTFGVPADEITPTATFEALGLDSLDLVELMVVVQEELGVRVEDDELEDLETLGDAIAVIASRASAVA